MDSVKYFATVCDAVVKSQKSETDLLELVNNAEYQAHAIEQLLAHNYRLIIKTVNQFKNALAEEEILSACIEGFTEAVKEYGISEKKQNFSLSTIAVNKMREKAMETIAELAKPITYSRSTVYRIQTASAMKANNKSDKEIAKKLKVSEKAVRNYLFLNKERNSFVDEDSLKFCCSKTSENRYKDLYEAINMLEERAKNIMTLKAHGATLEEIAEELEINLSTAKNTYYKALDEMRTMLDNAA